MVAIGALAALLAPAIASPVTANEPGIVLAQATRMNPRPGNEARQQDQYLDVLKKVRSECGNAAWTLWHSNSYDRWRKNRSSMLSMHHNTSSYQTLPPAPEGWPDTVRTKLEAAVKRGNDIVREAGATFKELADYINAKDYEDDKFKKGDELNQKLLAAGKECHAIQAELTGLYTEIATTLIDRRKANAAKPDVVNTMIADWQKTRGLAQELAKFDKADPAKLDGLVKEITALVEDRRANFAALKENPDTWVKRFYESALNDDIAVKMRRYLRDAKNPKAFKEMAEDRPRSNFSSVRSEIEMDLPDSILRYIASGK